ncbi:centrosomal protein kizuna isoform X2 [Choloepus didactylus]|uniref:centrosomal protein kizuna isoform X2 n=1 Tax=Choloepus didactylus TaxID=27675 RepID=UPI0018A1121B|nr:centrosomal protein kizuna isoform X2 [Choloepus didactylus]
MVGASPRTTRVPWPPQAARSQPGGGGAMRQASAPSAPLASSDYYENLGRLQHGLRDSEEKRLDLERKLYEYNQSDTYRVKLKYVKLKKYLKEICESEKRAHTRNQEYLKQLGRVQAHIEQFPTNTERLQKLKIEYKTQIKKMQLLSKDSLGIKGELKDEDREKVAMQAGINLGTAMSRGLYQPATIFMGRKMSAISSLGDFNTEQKSPQPTKNFSFPVPHSYRQTAQGSDVTDSCVVQTNSDTQCLNKSDRIDGKTSLQIGEKTPVTASALSEEEQTHGWERGSITCHGKSNLSESRKSAEPRSPPRERLSPENRTTDLKGEGASRSERSEEVILTQEHIEVMEERARPPVSPVSVSEYCASENKCPPENQSAWEDFSDHLPQGDLKSQRPFRKIQEEQGEESLSSSSSDLTVSVSEDDLIFESPEPQPNPGDKMDGEDGIEALKLIHTERERDALPTEKNNCILQTLSCPDSEKESSINSPRESVQLPEPGLLRPPWGQRGTSLKEQDDSLKEEKLFDVFTVRNMDQRMRATALLKKVLPEECDDRSSIHSNESSCRLPSILNDNSGVKEAKPWLQLNSVLTREQETKAYQLLKQSAFQDSTNQTEDRFQKTDVPASQLSGLDIGQGAFKTKTTNKITSEGSFSSREGSPLSRHENKRKLTANLKIKAFWGESDDSNSEIEAALRPKNHNTSTDDFDDFYD